jgi:hypothetical protein
VEDDDRVAPMSSKRSFHLVCLALAMMLGALPITNTSGIPWVSAQGTAPIYLPIIASNFLTGPGKITGKVIDASQPDFPIQGAQICVDSTNCATTDVNGIYGIESVLSGGRIATVIADKYATTTSFVEVVANQTATLNFALSPDLSASNVLMRTVVTWSPTKFWPPDNWPNDLDAYLWIDAQLPTLVFSANRGDCTVYPYACLEADYTEGFGPETIAIGNGGGQLISGATYYFGVYNFNQGFSSSVPPITQTSARVQVYNQAGIMETFEVPPTGSGDFWYVYSMDDTGKITPVNCITTLSSENLADLLAQCP